MAMMLITTSNSIKVKPQSLRAMVEALGKTKKKSESPRRERLPKRKRGKMSGCQAWTCKSLASWLGFERCFPEQLQPGCKMTKGGMLQPNDCRFLQDLPPTTTSSRPDSLCLGPVEVRSPCPPPGLRG